MTAGVSLAHGSDAVTRCLVSDCLMAEHRGCGLFVADREIPKDGMPIGYAVAWASRCTT